MKKPTMTSEDFNKALLEGNFDLILDELTKDLKEQDYDSEEDERDCGSRRGFIYESPKEELEEALNAAEDSLIEAESALFEMYMKTPDSPKWADLKYDLREIVDTMIELREKRFEEVLKEVPDDTEEEWELH